MAKLLIRLYGDPVLREISEPVEELDGRIEQLVQDMFETMYAAEGVGLAAPQVGVLKRLFIVDLQDHEEGSKPLVFINPKILERKGTAVMEEGCLSIPGIRSEIKRAEEVVVQAQDIKGQTFELRATGLLARAILHENDHLDGRLFVDYLSTVRRMLLREQLRQIEKMAKGEKVTT